MAASAAPLRPSRRERRKREVHERIAGAAVELFERQGFEATKVDEICERADVAQKTFFNHFSTKQLLVRELAEGILDELHLMLEEACKQPLPIREKLEAFFERVANDSERFARVRKELIVEVIRASQGDSAQTRKLHSSFGAMLREAAARGEVGNAHGVEFLTEMAVGVFTGIVLNWASLDGYPLRDRLAEAAEFLGAAIGPKMD
jgi:AcrR family transcriptional regulator